MVACFLLFSASLVIVLPNTRNAMSCTSFTRLPLNCMTIFKVHQVIVLTNKMTDKCMQLCVCVCYFNSFSDLPNCSISLAIKASEEPGFSRSMFTKALETLYPTDPFAFSPPRAYISYSLLREGRLLNVRDR